MMINKINTTLKIATLSLVLAVTSCGSDSSEASSAVQQAEMLASKYGTAFNMFSSLEDKLCIFSVNLGEIIEKMNWDSQDLPPEAAMVYSIAKPYTTTEYLGLNLDKPAYGVVVSDDIGEPEFVAYTMEVDDPKKLDGLLALAGISNEVEPIVINGESFSSISERGMQVVWDDKDVLVVASPDGYEVEEFVKKLMTARNIPGSEDEELISYFSRKDDINAFYQMKDLTKLAKTANPSVKMPEEYLALIENGSSIFSVNFNMGELLISGDISADEFKNSEFNMFNTEPIDPSFNEYLTNDKLIAAGMFSLNMEVFANMIQMFGIPEEDMAGFKDKTGMELTDLLKLGTGEFALSFNAMEYKSMDFSDQTISEMAINHTVENNGETPLFIFTAGINDSATIGEMIRSKPMVTSKDGYYSLGNESHMVIKENKLIITTDEETAAFLGSGSSYPAYLLPNDLDISKNIFGFMNTDTETLPNDFINMMNENKEGRMIVDYLNKLKTINVECEFDKVILSIKAKDKSKNILELITSLVMKEVKKEMEISSVQTDEAWLEEEFDAAEY